MISFKTSCFVVGVWALKSDQASRHSLFRTEIWCVVDWVRVGKQTKKLDVRVEERMCNLLIYVVFME